VTRPRPTAFTTATTVACACPRSAGRKPGAPAPGYANSSPRGSTATGYRRWRTVETAGTLGLGGAWTIDDRWRERDWGEYGVLTGTEQEEQFRISSKLRTQSKWYWRPPGGESLATGVWLRFEDILDTMHRELDGKRVIAVTHGEMIETARLVLERMLPEEWQQQESDDAYKIVNCHVLHYTRRAPDAGEVARRLQWRRSVCAHDETKSWFSGKWEELTFRTFTDAQLLAFADEHPNLLD